MVEFSKYQKEAIEINDKHLRIIACAGSGKTTTVAAKVAHLLNPANGLNIQPENIIAFTYTDRAASELKNKILNAVGSYRGMANMYIGTIHGWCLKALQENEYGYQSFSVLNEIKLKLFIDKYYETIGMKDVKKIKVDVSLRRFIDTSIFTKLMDIIRESELVEGNELPENLKKARIKYESILISKKYFDFSMIMDKALHCLTPESNLSKSLNHDLKYLIVDEYQDVNPIQEKLINKIHEVSNCNVVVVGDDDQNIYQWRGSNNKYIIDFDKKFQPNEFQNIPLGINYRSSEGITRLAESLILNNKIRIQDKKMESNKNQEFIKGQDLLYHEYNNIEEENEAIANYIEDIIGVEFDDDGQKRGLAYSDIAILLRTWSKAESIVQILDKHKIPYVTAGVNQLFETPEVKAALGIYTYLYEELSKEELEKMWLSLPSNTISPEKLVKAIENLDLSKPNLDKVKKNWEYSLQDILWDFIEKGEIFEEKFIDNSTDDLYKRTKERAEIIFFNLGKFSQVISDFEEINFNRSNPSFHLFNFLSFITYAARDYYPEGWLNNTYKTPNAIQIMTVHQAKGLEFPSVIIPGLNQNYLPVKKRGGLSEWHFLEKSLIHEQSRYEGDENKEDERRLLYVAITRSQKYLLLTRAPDLNNRLYTKESLFIPELAKANILVQNKSHKFNPLHKIESKPKEKVKNISLDFTTLKDFFECPYRFKLVSVYGFKFPLNQRMGVGKSFHNCLMEIHNRVKSKEQLDTKALLDIAQRQTHFPYLTDSIKLKKPLWKKVRDNVVEYYEDNKDSLDNIEFVEQDIQYKLDDNILVLGRIDLIKKRLDSGKYETYIVEFKSDDDKKRGKITEDQLKLYALGHRELTGELADYIMTYVIGENKEKIPQKLNQNDIEEIENKIKSAVERIRKEDFGRIDTKEICTVCFQNSLCSNIIRFNVKNQR